MSQSSETSQADTRDPVLVSSLREFRVIVIGFAICCLWSVSTCYFMGYYPPLDQPIAKVMGMPAWVFWGLAVPWVACDIFTLWFCFFFMTDQSLGEDEPEPADVPESAGGSHA